jgi:hypothetical protein
MPRGALLSYGCQENIDSRTKVARKLVIVTNQNEMLQENR